ncbi:hypothetical protein NKW84_04855 [Acetobacter senegalensis]|uniref:ATP12 family chaperone protein n=1 Tax=Acetobacter senegalensis TaxID=446692 RepID=UPI00209D1E62|nr:hypothetical protein [Acetobacter senegalensis]
MSENAKAVAASAGRKRFWKQASVVPDGAGYAVQLDGRPVRLPERTPLRVESRALADALAEEWQAAGKEAGGLFRPEDLPLTGIVGSMLERIPAQWEGVVESLLAYAGSDLLCYRAENWSDLARLQKEQWTPWLDWCCKRFDAPLEVSEGIMPIAQPAETFNALRRVLEQTTPAQLAALSVAVPALGSLVLGLALVEQQADPETLVACATLDERAQMQRWGEDTEITDRIAALVREVSDAARFLALSRQN